MVENEEVFDKIDGAVEIPAGIPPAMQPAEEAVFGEVSDRIKFDVELNIEDKDRVFEIETVELKKPQLIDSNGNEVEPKASQNDPTKLFYESKLILTYKDSNYASIVSTVKWYKQTREENGKTKIYYNPWFNTNIVEEQLTDKLTSDISKLFFRYCKKKGLDKKKVTQKAFLEGLKGMKVKLESQKGKYKGNDWAKLVVSEFV